MLVAFPFLMRPPCKAIDGFDNKFIRSENGAFDRFADASEGIRDGKVDGEAERVRLAG